MPMRHPLPFVATAFSFAFAAVAIGAGLMHLLKTVWPFWVGLATAIAVPAWGLAFYWRAEEPARRRIYHGLWVAWCMEFAFVFGGMPGALVGHVVAGNRGQMIGYFTTAIFFASLAGRRAYVRGPQWGGGLNNDEISKRAPRRTTS